MSWCFWMLQGQNAISLSDEIPAGQLGPVCTCTPINPLGWCHFSTLPVSPPAASIHWPHSVTLQKSRCSKSFDLQSKKAFWALRHLRSGSRGSNYLRFHCLNLLLSLLLGDYLLDNNQYYPVMYLSGYRSNLFFFTLRVKALKLSDLDRQPDLCNAALISILTPLSIKTSITARLTKTLI